MKRFVSGANCPQCNSTDSVRMWREHNKQFIDCIHCDFSKTIDNATDQQATTKLIGIKTLDID